MSRWGSAILATEDEGLTQRRKARKGSKVVSPGASRFFVSRIVCV
jgi:hypothetical protein